MVIFELNAVSFTMDYPSLMEFTRELSHSGGCFSLTVNGQSFILLLLDGFLHKVNQVNCSTFFHGTFTSTKLWMVMVHACFLLMLLALFYIGYKWKFKLIIVCNVNDTILSGG